MRVSAGALLVAAIAASGCARAPKPAAPRSAPAVPASRRSPRPTLPALLPAPANVEFGAGEGFTLGAGTVVAAASSDPAVQRAARQLSEWIRRSTGLAIAVTSAPPAADASAIELVVDAQRTTGAEGYELTIGPRRATLAASTPAGLFYATQTFRQLLPYWSEYEAVAFRQPQTATLPSVRVRDSPRFEWRGAMLDVARHFFSVDEVKRFVDLEALHKMNRLHLHLADDQGWRIEIRKWPNLTAKGGVSEVGGTPGGFYTQAQFAEIASYAAERFVTVVPEIDMPGHTNAALSSYAELNCGGQAPPPFTGIDVGFSALCVDKEITYRFLDDVIGEIAGTTPGRYFHMGGDEVRKLTADQYRAFVERVQTIVRAHGKEMIGWDEIAGTALAPSSIVQHWRPDAPAAALARAPRLILSPGNRTYLDMKYDGDTRLGLDWAGRIPVKASYDWDPAALVPGARAILGVEAPLWSETAANMRDVEFLAMPRLAAIAEVAWSPQEARDWEEFRARLGAQAPRWTALGINFYRAPDVPWK
jgi:hexosaminidase